MTKKIILTLSQDGTGNNKVNDNDTGNQTNVARIHDSLVADYSFNISTLDPRKPEENGTSSLEDVTNHLEGNAESFGEFVSSISGDEADIAPSDDPLHIKLYQNGVGSRGDGSFQDTWEGATGTGTGARINTFSDAIEVIHDAYGGDVEIEINCIRDAVTVWRILVNPMGQAFAGFPHLDRGSSTTKPIHSVTNPSISD